MNKFLILIFTLQLSLFSQTVKIGDNSDGSRSTPVHLIKLIDADSSVIRLDEKPLLPFSTKYTCGSCHDYNKISSGWHFTAGDSSTNSGRSGQPWIYVDAHSATQIPISLREWPGTFHPGQIGMNSFEFISRFGRHMPGGSVGEKEATHELDMFWRWQVSGKMEINCLSCHDLEKTHDQAEYTKQIIRQNYQWAATASSGFAAVEGAAINLPDNYDIYAGGNPGGPQGLAPFVEYQAQRFNKKNEVFFDISRKVPVERCYYCHSTKRIDSKKNERWHFDEDVHIKAGMLCVDCHRHGLDHKMNRGYEQDEEEKFALTCEGCHLGRDENEIPLNGRLGAPKPKHLGMPLVHFEKLSCTTCHSANWPTENTGNVKTSIAHGLGMHRVNKNDLALPHVKSPVFIKQDDDKYAPHNLIWPAYWAEMEGNSIHPLKMDIFIPIARKIIGHIDSLGNGDWPALADSNLVKVLDSLANSGLVKNQPVYITGGELIWLDKNKAIKRQKHFAAEPYSWPIAHDVRPAAQALGSRSCQDCHSTSSPIYFANIEIDTPLKTDKSSKIAMTTFLQKNKTAAWIFSFSFLFRPWLKYLILSSCLIIFAVLISYGISGTGKILSIISSSSIKDQEGNVN